ncbi:MAG: GNAT family N-acetyltransferase [Ignavibacteria bacterium]|nr:GNAT family N-acetyltransferase [Ignavibacteria bacterium]
MKIRKAELNDLSQIAKILAGDKLGRFREEFAEPLPVNYIDAFEKIDANPSQILLVAEGETGQVVGTMQLSFIQYLTYRGGLRAQAEAVFVREDCRGKGVGSRLMKYAIEQSMQRGAHLLQLTTDKQRPEAVKFYEKLGFKASHEGMKLHIN